MHSFKMRMNHFILLLFTYYGFGEFSSVQFDIKFLTRVVPKLAELFKNISTYDTNNAHNTMSS